MLAKADFIKLLNDNEGTINPTSRVIISRQSGDLFALCIATVGKPNHFISLHKYGSSTGEKACGSYRAWLAEWFNDRRMERADTPDVPCKTRDDVITTLKESAPDAALSDYVAALEDEEALAALGFIDADQDAVEKAHAYLKNRIEVKRLLFARVQSGFSSDVRSRIDRSVDNVLRVTKMETLAREAVTQPREPVNPRVYESTADALKSGDYDQYGVEATAQLISDMQHGLVYIQPVVNPDKCLLRVGLRLSRWFDSPEQARRGYELMRDASGEGASTRPNGVIVLSDAQTVIYVSYNGRAWYDKDGAHAVPLPLATTKELIAGSAAVKNMPAPSEALSIRERYTAIVISTAHIQERDSEALAGGRYNGDNDSGCHFVHDIPGGYCLRLYTAGDDWGPQLYDLGISQAAIWNLSRLYNEGYRVVLLQADGDIIDNLKSWEW